MSEHAQATATHPPTKAVPSRGQDQASASAGFDERRLQTQLARDASLRQVVLGLLMASLVVGVVYEPAASYTGLWTLLMLGIWFSVSFINAQVSQQLPRITAALEDGSRVVEHHINQALRRMPLQRWVRLLLYHRLAVLRHRQGRFGEVSAICVSLLGRELGPVDEVRSNLLLMLVDARLALGDASGAYQGLRQLQRRSLSLVETLQRLALQTRYELMIHRPEAALRDLPQRLDLAEIMPPQHCAAMHQMFAQAAEAEGHEQLARDLKKRADLLWPAVELPSFVFSESELDADPEPLDPQDKSSNG